MLMTEIKIRGNEGVILETLKIQSTPTQFIIYRGRLLEKMNGDANNYIERLYLEIN